MVWGLPPARAGRAPQASRHSMAVEAAVSGTGGAAVAGEGGGPVGLCGARVAGPVSECERPHPLTITTAPAPATSLSSWRRLTGSRSASRLTGLTPSIDEHHTKRCGRGGRYSGTAPARHRCSAWVSARWLHGRSRASRQLPSLRSWWLACQVWSSPLPLSSPQSWNSGSRFAPETLPWGTFEPGLKMGAGVDRAFSAVLAERDIKWQFDCHFRQTYSEQK